MCAVAYPLRIVYMSVQVPAHVLVLDVVRITATCRISKHVWLNPMLPDSTSCGFSGAFTYTVPFVAWCVHLHRILPSAFNNFSISLFTHHLLKLLKRTVYNILHLDMSRLQHTRPSYTRMYATILDSGLSIDL